MIRSLDQMVEQVLLSGRKFRIAVAWAHDLNTLSAITGAVNNGFAEAILIGDPSEIKKTITGSGINPLNYIIVSAENEIKAANEAVRMANADEADIVMKGLLGTDKFLKAILNKESGLMLPDSILSYVGAIEIPAYNKLLFIADPAVIPFPAYSQNIIMLEY